ncbi:MAG: 50S ribosomal protein L6 [Nitrospirae bacterium]|nr:50S ribosomal protein L6 [Nitrospirota bacterium]MBI5694907.1 50S ribosomal protein L6 [Nitrospirota bacterium]
MSRIGKAPIEVPAGVEIKLDKSDLVVKGPKGVLKRTLNPKMIVKYEGNVITVERPSDDNEHRSLHGLTRTLINNMVLGVTKGFERVLEINGVGYKAEAKGEILLLNMGYSHPVNFELPKGISATVEKQTVVKLAGIDKELLGQVAANVRAVRKPEPYKGKGIKYAEETILRKEGKKGK